VRLLLAHSRVEYVLKLTFLSISLFLFFVLYLTSSFSFDKFSPGCQWVEIAGNCKRFVVSTKRKFLYFAAVLTAAGMDAVVDGARRNHEANAEVDQPANKRRRVNFARRCFRSVHPF